MIFQSSTAPLVQSMKSSILLKKYGQKMNKIIFKTRIPGIRSLMKVILIWKHVIKHKFMWFGKSLWFVIGLGVEQKTCPEILMKSTRYLTWTYVLVHVLKKEKLLWNLKFFWMVIYIQNTMIRTLIGQVFCWLCSPHLFDCLVY